MENCHSNMVSRWVLSLQRAGRIIRQSNENKNVSIYRYVTKGTFDAYSYQTLENKQKFISQIMTSNTPARKCQDVDQQALTYSEIKAFPEKEKNLQTALDNLHSDREHLRKLPIDEETKLPVFKITIGETEYTDRKEAAKALETAVLSVRQAAISENK